MPENLIYIQSPQPSDIHIGSVVKINPLVDWGNNLIRMRCEGMSYHLRRNKMFEGERTIKFSHQISQKRIELSDEFYTRNMLLVKGIDYDD